MEVTLMEMLEAREQRAARQRALLDAYGHTMVCFTMNIAGPIKNSPSILRGFLLGKQLLEDQLRVTGTRVLYHEQIRLNQVIGCALAVVGVVLVVQPEKDEEEEQP